ncbi:MAG: 5'-nucleotidase [Saonia sp.]
MVLKIKHFVIFITIIGGASCKQESAVLKEITGKQLTIDSAIVAADSIDTFVTPYRDRVNEVLDSTLAYAPMTISKEDGEYNTSAGNLMADIVLEMAKPIFKARTKKDIDFAVLNHGGIRSIISAGNVTARTAYEVMPFENTIVVVALDGRSVRELISFLINSDRPHPIAGMQIQLDKNDSLQSVNIQEEPFNENRIYYVATSNYLVSGGDNMGFFKHGTNVTETEYKIRNAIIDYFKKMDTILPIVDDRFIKLD